MTEEKKVRAVSRNEREQLRYLTAWFRLKLYWQILIAFLLAIFLSLLLGERLMPVSILGTVFLQLLKMIIIPLIISSIVTGVAGVGSGGRFGRLFGKIGTYYILSSLAAILTGLFMVNTIRPGIGAKLGLEKSPEDLETAVETVGDLLFRIIPDNVVGAMTRGEILPVIFFSILFGLFITRLPEKQRDLMVGFFESFFAVMMRMTGFIMKLVPYGVFGLVSKMIITTGFNAFIPLGKYMITVALALVFHACITLPLALYFLARVSPIKYVRAMASALMTAFSTSSSSATLPLTMECVEKNAGVSNTVSSFVLPLGATVNMDGTALYECVAVMFISQAYGIELGFYAQFKVVLTALLASIGAAGIPAAGLVMMAIVLRSVGLPLEAVGLVLAVDRILDMCRTTVNVWSDSTGAVIVARTEGEKDLPVSRYRVGDG